jgi:hypothetical protein
MRSQYCSQWWPRRATHANSLVAPCVRGGQGVFNQHEIYAPPRWKGEPLILPALPDRKILKAYVHGKPDQAIAATMDATTLTVTVPEELRDPIDTIVVLELDGDAVAIPPINTWVGATSGK